MTQKKVSLGSWYSWSVPLTRNKIVMRVVGANDLIKASTFSCVVSINYDR